jgi:cell division protein FtsW (lipid II flippase)
MQIEVECGGNIAVMTTTSLVRIEIDQISDEGYRTVITAEELQAAQALLRIADFAFPHLLKTHGDGGVAGAVGSSLWTIGLLAAIKYDWLSIDVAMMLLAATAALLITFGWTMKRERTRVMRIFTDPFLDARTIINGKEARGEGQSWVEGSKGSIIPNARLYR